jgi:predicted ATP-dependent protease
MVSKTPPNKKNKRTVMRKAELKANQLSRPCDPSSLGFQTTDELPDLQDVIGQPRALRALELGSELTGPGYNTFVLGSPGSGRTTLTLEYLQRKATHEAVPNDWCYVNNFDNPHSPRAVCMPAGLGIELRKDIQELIAFGERELPRAFESDEFTHAREQLVNNLKKSQEAEFVRLQDHVEKFKFAIVRTPFGLVLVPAVQGKPLTQEEIQALTQDQRAKLEELQVKLSEEVEKSIKRLHDLALETAEQISELNSRTALFVISPIIGRLREKYHQLSDVIAYLDAVQADVIKNARNFHDHESSESGSAAQEQSWKNHYEVNLLVDNSKLEGAPVIFESQPAYYNLMGRIEHVVVMGATRTDLTMIRSGALHRANGGYLILSARDLLINPYAWEGLKRVLRDKAIRMIDLGSQLGLLSTETLDPEPIPLNIKIVLIGTPLLYYLLRYYDEDFAKLFKVRAEFATLMDRSPQTEHEYGLFVKSVLVDNQLPAFSNDAVARIIDFSSRLAEDQRKLSTRFGKISDLIREAAYWAKKETAAENPPAIIDRTAVEKAIDETFYRNNLIEERIQELISQGVLIINTSGTAVGQINALSVYFTGDYSFGRPCRVSAAVYPGRAGVIDIERQAKLGGPIHTKGVLIINGLLGARYGHCGPLNLSASLTFEQAYDEIEGDSASAAELFALLSALSKVGLRQDIAVTGSVNQHGQIQPVGGVNEKIEGFYNACAARGLTGEQGVIIPKANEQSLFLRQEVLQSVERNKFHVWSVETIDQGLEILSGMPVGELQPDGSYPPETINQAVAKRLQEFSHQVAELKNGSPATLPQDNHPEEMD